MKTKQNKEQDSGDISEGDNNVSFEIDTYSTPPIKATQITFNDEGEIETEWSEDEKDSYEEYLREINNGDQEIDVEVEADEEIEEETPRPTKQKRKAKEKAPEQSEEVERVTTQEEQSGEQSEDEQGDEVVQKKELSRSQKRVLESRKEVNEAREAQFKAELKAQEAELQRFKALELVADARKKELQSTINTLIAQVAQAELDSDVEAKAKLQDALIQSRIQLSQTEGYEKDLKEGIATLEERFETVKKGNLQSSANKTPEAALEWIQGKEFLTDNQAYAKLPKEKRGQALQVRQVLASTAQELMTEGFDPQDPFFYEELDLRLENKFSFYRTLALGQEDMLNSEGNQDTSGGETIKKPTDKPSQKSTPTEKARSLPVSGPTAISSKNTSNNASTNPDSKQFKVKLSKEHLEIFENYVKPQGISLQEYALLVAKEEKSSR